MRLRGYDEETEELSTDVQVLTGKIADLTKTASNPVGISLFTDESRETYKSTYQILEEVAGIWDELTDKNRAELLEAIAGKRSAQTIASILENWSSASDAIKVMEESAGSAEREMSVMMDSIQYKLNAFKETWTSIAQQSISSDFMKDMVDQGIRLLEIIEKSSSSLKPVFSFISTFTDTLVSLSETLGTVGTILASVIVVNALKGVNIFKQLWGSAKSLVVGLNTFGAVMQKVNTSTTLTRAEFKRLCTQINLLNEAQVNYVLSSNNLTNAQKYQILRTRGLTKEEARRRLGLLGVTTAEEGATASTISFKGALQGLGATIAANPIGALITAITIAISAYTIWKQKQDEIKESSKNLISELEGVQNKTQQLAKNSNEIVDRYAELSKGVNVLGENVSLTSDEFDEYHELTNKIAEDIPSLITGYDNQGNAILNLRDNVDELKQAYIDARKEAYRTAIASEEVDKSVKNFNNYNGNGFVATAYNSKYYNSQTGTKLSYKEALDAITKAKDMTYDELKSALNNGDFSSSEMEYLNLEFGLKLDMNQEQFVDGMQKLRTEFKTVRAEYDEVFKSIQKIAEAYLYLDDDFDNLSDKMQTFASVLVNNIPEDIASQWTTKGDIDNYVTNNIIKPLLNATPDVQKAFEGLIDFKYDDSKSISENKKEIDNYISQLASYLNLDENQLKLMLGVAETDNLNDELNRIIRDASNKFKVSAGDIITPDTTALSINTKEEIQLFADAIDEAYESGMTYAEMLELYKQKLEVVQQQESVTLRTLEEIQEAYGDTSKAVGNYTKEQKTLTTALDEMSEHGQLSADTIQSLVDAGYASALVYDEESGKITTSKEALELLNAQKREELRLDLEKKKKDVQDLYDQEVEKINEKASAMAQVNQQAASAYLTEQMAHNVQLQNLQDWIDNYNGLLNSLNAPTFGSSGKSSSSDPWKEKFENKYKEQKHLLEMGKLSEEDFINWLDDAYKEYFSDLTKYQDEYNKYEEEVYKSRKSREQDLFEAKISNYEKLADKALDDKVDDLGGSSKWEYARAQIQSAIAETQARIDTLKSSGLQNVDDEIKKLEESLDKYADKLEDINKKEIAAEKDYIKKLKDEYDDMIDDRVKKYKELSDTIEKAYDKEIKAIDKQKDAIDKQIDALEKKNKEEDRQKDILDKQKSVREAMLALEKAQHKTRIVYNGYGWEARQDEEAVTKAQEDLAKAKDELNKAYQEDVKAKLEEQKDKLDEQKKTLEEAKDNAKDYYSNITDNLSKQKDTQDKIYESLTKIYEELGGDTTQTESNTNLVKGLSSENLTKAIESLSESEKKSLFDAGVVTQDKDGNIVLDYGDVKDNTEAIDKLKDVTLDANITEQEILDVLKQFLPENYNKDNQEDDAGVITVGNKKLRPMSYSEWQKRHTADEWQTEGQKKKRPELANVTMEEYLKKPFAGHETFASLIKGMMDGSVKPMANVANQMINKNIQAKTSGNDLASSYVNNNVNSTPVFNVTNVIEGSVDQKTIDEMNKSTKNIINEYFKYLTTNIPTTVTQTKYST